MAKWKEGDKVKIVDRPVTEEDRKSNAYFSHMAGVTGVVQYIYKEGLISILVDPASLPKISSEVHKTASVRMRTKFIESIGEEQRKTLTSEELNFPVNFNLLVAGDDLISAKG
jgi:hypothetical protein